MELRHLRYFIAVAEELHFGRAATRLHIAQPPLSQQIRQLEEELGLKLFLRRHRSIELTQAGRVFLPEAKQILSQMRRAAEDAKRADRGQIGPLVVACGPLAVHTVLPLVLKAFRARFPEVDLSLRESTEHEILETLQERTVDVGFLIPYFESKILRRDIVLMVPMMAALPKAHPLAGRRSIRLKQLANERFLLFSRVLTSGFYDHAVGLCQRAGFTPNVVQEAAQHPTLLAMVAAGYGVSLIPALRKPAVAPEDVALVRIQEPWATMQLCIAWRAGDASSVVAAFLAVVKACCRKAIGRKPRPRAGRKRRR